MEVILQVQRCTWSLLLALRVVYMFTGRKIGLYIILMDTEVHQLLQKMQVFALGMQSRDNMFLHKIKEKK